MLSHETSQGLLDGVVVVGMHDAHQRLVGRHAGALLETEDPVDLFGPEHFGFTGDPLPVADARQPLRVREALPAVAQVRERVAKVR